MRCDPGVSAEVSPSKSTLPSRITARSALRARVARVVHDEIRMHLGVGVDRVVDEPLAGRPAPRRLRLVVLAVGQEERRPAPSPRQWNRLLA